MLVNAVPAANSSPDYSYKSAKKNPITSRSNSGHSRVDSRISMVQLMEVTGGTGRFNGATGELVGHVYVEYLGVDVPDWPVKFILPGFIVY
jgi:hypothetical protein